MAIFSHDYTMPSAEDEFFRNRQRQAIETFVATLPRDLAELYQLQFVEGLPSRAIAAHWRQPVWVVYRATRQLTGRIAAARQELSSF